MPKAWIYRKDRIDNAIKRASAKDEGILKCIRKGMAPWVAIWWETATDNTTRTVANIRMSYFNRETGTLGKTGSSISCFSAKVFRIVNDGKLNTDDLELELIDHGLRNLWIRRGGNNHLHSLWRFWKNGWALEEKKIEVKTDPGTFANNFRGVDRRTTGRNHHNSSISLKKMRRRSGSSIIFEIKKNGEIFFAVFNIFWSSHQIHFAPSFWRTYLHQSLWYSSRSPATSPVARWDWQLAGCMGWTGISFPVN